MNHLMKKHLRAYAFIFVSVMLALPSMATADISMALQATDGTLPFDGAAGAGQDTGNNNNIIRTLDTLSYIIDYSVFTSAETNITFTLVLTGDAEWEALLPICQTAGVAPLSSLSLDKKTFVCNVGDAAIGGPFGMTPVAKVLADAVAGTDITMTVNLATDSNTDGPIIETDTVSTAPQYELRAGSISNLGLKPNAMATEDGVVYAFRVELLIDGGKGSEPLASPFSITDELMTGFQNFPPDTVLYNWGSGNEAHGGCGINFDTPVGFAASNMPKGKLSFSVPSPERAVSDSGAWTCSQTGTEITMTITSADTAGDHLPTALSSGGPIPANDSWVVAGWVQVWVPISGLVGNISARHELALGNDALGVNSGSGNLAGADNPANNRRSTTIIVDGGSFSSFYYDDNRTLFPTKSGTTAGDGLAASGQIFTTRSFATNQGVNPFTNGEYCQKFDPVSQRVIERVFGSDEAVDLYQIDDLASVIVQYGYHNSIEFIWGDGTVDIDTRFLAMRDTFDCDDAAITYVASLDLVPVGRTVSHIYIQDDVPAGDKLEFVVRVQVKDSVPNVFENGDLLVTNFSYRTDELTAGAWTTSTDYVPSTHAGNPTLDDRLTLTGAVVRISKFADVGVALAGDSVNYSLHPTVTISILSAPDAENVLITDTLPDYLTYTVGSALQNGVAFAPTVTVNVDGTTTLVWDLGDVTPNVVIPNITYTTSLAAEVPNLLDLNNTVVISSDDDSSTLAQRSAQASVLANNLASVFIQKQTNTPMIVAGGNIEYVLRYGNDGISDINGMEMIDIFPASGDALGSSFAGQIELSSVTASNGEMLFYTNLTSGLIHPDPADVSNQPGGSTIWCEAADFGIVGCPTNLAGSTAIRIVQAAILAVGDPALEVNLEFTTSAGNVMADIFRNQFSARSDSLDILLHSNTVSTVVDIAPYFTISKAVSPNGEVVAGATLAYTVVIENIGSGVACNASFDDVLPAGLVLNTASVTVGGGPYDAGSLITTNNTIAFDLGGVPGGCAVGNRFNLDTLTVNYTATLDIPFASPEVINQAGITGYLDEAGNPHSSIPSEFVSTAATSADSHDTVTANMVESGNDPADPSDDNPTSVVVQVLQGDCDGINGVNTADVICALNRVLNNEPPIYGVDIDSDSDVDIQDVVGIIDIVIN